MTNFLDALGPDGFGPAKTITRGIGDAGQEEGKTESLGGKFASELADAIRKVDDFGNSAKVQADALARGEPVELHELMISVSKSEVAFHMMLEVRNKLLDAWQTISRSAV